MLYIDFACKEHNYKLRLNTRGVITLEKLLGKNPLKVFSDIKEDGIIPVQELMTIFYVALGAYQPEMNLEAAYTAFDEWIEEGHYIAEFIPIVVELYQEAGLVEKN